MKRQIVFSLVCFLLLLSACKNHNPSFRKISLNVLRDKIAGGWAGKMIGVTYGAPTEFRALGKIYTDSILWKPSDIRGSLWQDDLYVQLSFLMTMDSFGIHAPSKKFQEMFATAGFPLWHANMQSRKNYFDSIFPPASGNPANNIHADDIDFQIEADYIGFMCPGMPKELVTIADSIGHIMNYGDGVYGGIFVGSMYSAAFFENDIRKIIETALQSIPSGSEYAQTIRDVLLLHDHYPDNWRQAWQELQLKWGETHICEAGSPFNIDAKLNGAYIVMGLLYGNGDPVKTMEITVRCGQDSDCNPANAMAVLGVMKGFSQLPDSLRLGVKDVGNSLFINTSYSFNKAVETTMKYALQLIRDNGGKVTRTQALVRSEKPAPPPLEVSFRNVVFDMNIPVTDHAAWKMSTGWQEYKISEGKDKPTVVQSVWSDQKGEAISLTFNGNGVSLTGNWLGNCGKADIILDGKKVKTIDCWYFHNKQEHHGISIWHILGLPNGEHTLSILVRGEKRPESTGSRIYISGATIFKDLPKKNEGFRFSFDN